MTRHHSQGNDPTTAVEHFRQATAATTRAISRDGEVEVEFVTRLREMARFDGIEELLAAMSDDVRRTREVLGV